MEKKSSHFLEMSFFKLLVSKCFCKDNRTIITIYTTHRRVAHTYFTLTFALLGKNGNIQETYSIVKPRVLSSP